MSGQGLALRLALQRLHAHHGLAPIIQHELPAFPSTAAPLVITGLAVSTTTIDSGRQLFAPRSLSFRGFPPLLYRHEGAPVGRITDLAWRSDGLHLSAVVDNDIAKRAGGLSVCASVHSYELRNVDDAQKFHGVITAGTIDEISITRNPANRLCLVASRSVLPHNDLMQRVSKITRMIEQLRELSSHANP